MPRKTNTTSTRLGLVRDLRGEDEGSKQRMAFNTPVQGSSAEVLYEAINALAPAITGNQRQAGYAGAR